MAGKHYDVYVLGDVETSKHLGTLTEKAAEAGAVVSRTFAFPTGCAAAHDDLTEVDAVVEALGTAIATRTPLWLPYWFHDICREEHLRRISLTLQRHGLDLLLGPHLEPLPVHGGISEIDAALRNEVRAVYALDDAAMAAVGVRSLMAELEAGLDPAEEPFDPLDDIEPEPWYFNTAEVAAALGKSSDWVSRGLRLRLFAYPDGSPVVPLGSGKGGRRRFTTAMLRAIAWSSYRRGTLEPQQLVEVLADLVPFEQ